MKKKEENTKEFPLTEVESSALTTIINTEFALQRQLASVGEQWREFWRSIGVRLNLPPDTKLSINYKSKTVVIL